MAECIMVQGKAESGKCKVENGNGEEQRKSEELKGRDYRITIKNHRTEKGFSISEKYKIKLNKCLLDILMIFTLTGII
jgi:hypothetical protein